MPVINVVRRNLFRDSIQLMRLTEDVKKLAGIEDAVVSMGTDTNKRLLRELGLLGGEGKNAGDGDLIMAVRVGKGTVGDEVMKRVELMVIAPPTSSEGKKAAAMHSIHSALEQFPGANLAIVSVPGRQAFEPSMELLRAGLNVHLFSDHVPIEKEIELKTYAHSKRLLLLGPGAGTSIINGVGLGFANSVRRGEVGIVASAGTGIQEASIMLDRVGLGVSEALGVGGTDVTEEVGGLMMKDSLGLLEKDKGTRIIMIIAKAPKEKVMRDVMAFVEKRTSKPVVACFLGLDSQSKTGRRVVHAKTLHRAVSQASKVSGPKGEKEFKAKVAMSFEDLAKLSRKLYSGLGSEQRFVRGLYSGGTLAHETLLIFRDVVGEAYSNTPLSSKFALRDPNVSRENSIIDLGDEFFTAGRAHPMIDPTLRRLRISQEGADSKVAAIMLDIVLGYGSSPDPGGSLLRSIDEAKDGAKSNGGSLVVMAHVCGTESDPQSLKEQSRKLRGAGVVLFASNALMAAAGALLVGGEAARVRLNKNWGELIG